MYESLYADIAVYSVKLLTDDKISFIDGNGKSHTVTLSKGLHGYAKFRYKGADYYLKLCGRVGDRVVYHPYRVCLQREVVPCGTCDDNSSVISLSQFESCWGKFLMY